MSKTLDAVHGYDLAMVEEVIEQTARRKRPRTAYDLGTFPNLLRPMVSTFTLDLYSHRSR